MTLKNTVPNQGGKKPPSRFILHSLYFLFSVSFLLCIILVSASWMFIAKMIYPTCQSKDPEKQIPIPEITWLSTVDGHLIQVWFYPPQNGSAIIVLGGLSGSLTIENFPKTALLEQGYGLLFVDSRSCAKPRSPVTLGVNEIYDAEAALDFLLLTHHINEENIGVWGFSMGGATAIRLAAKRGEVRAIVRDGGFADFKEIFTSTPDASVITKMLQSLNLTFFEYRTGADFSRVSLTDELSNLQSRPLLLIYGESEKKPGIKQFEQAQEPKTLWIVPGSTHGRNYETAPAQYEQKIIRFFNQHLRINQP